MPKKKAAVKKKRAAAKKVTAKRAVVGNKATAKKRGRTRRASARTLAAEEANELSGGHSGGVVGKFFLALLILPFCYVTMETSFALVVDLARGDSILRSSEFWCFSLGVAAWLAAFAWLPRPVLVYVFGHEATHAVMAFFCGADVPHFKASSSGGYIYTTKSNVLISLAPYLFPFYTLIILAASVFLTYFVDVYAYRPEAVFGTVGVRWIWIIMGLLGLSWCFHITFTVWMIGKHQPDLAEHGVFFSLVLIILANLLILCLFLVVGSSEIDFASFFGYWIEGLRQLGENLMKMAAGLSWLVQRGVEEAL